MTEIVERQINAWRLKRHLTEAQFAQKADEEAPNVITLSNERGAGGLEVARQLGELLNMPVYDREIVEHMATHKHVRVSTVETLDQHALGRIDDYLTNLFRDWSFDQTDYARALVHTLLLLWHHGPAILVGRGAVHVIPRQHALAVRVVGNKQQRIDRVAKLDNISADEAARLITESDSERNRFSRHYFGVDIDDASTYDLVLNTSYLSTQGSAALAADAFRLKFANAAEPKQAIDPSRADLPQAEITG